tara:strand:+ start:256 stop:393 length:138 start_codon:yes stop_codon:yes gene_type:complete
MKKTKKIIKDALKHPELFTLAELAYFETMKRIRKEAKQKRKQEKD